MGTLSLVVPCFSNCSMQVAPGSSDSSVDTHDELEAIFDADKKVLSVINIEAELTLECIMHMDASLDADLVVLTVPIGLVGDWNTVPAVGVNTSELRTDTSNDTFGEDMWL